VPTPHDKQFEAYLKRFHPIAPEPVPTRRVSHASPRSVSLGSWLAAVAAILVIGAVILHIRSHRVVGSNTAHDVAFAERHAPAGPLTMRSANAWLATAPSFKVAVDDLAFRSQASALPQGQQSAVAVLSKEKNRL
jgi:hypothetical protein